MRSNPSSPKARRRSSTQASTSSTTANRHSRRISQYSPISRRSSRISNEGLSLASDPITLTQTEDVMGSLADELADAWDDEEAIDEGANEFHCSKLSNEVASPVSPVTLQDLERARDSGIDVDSPLPTKPHGGVREGGHAQSDHGTQHQIQEKVISTTPQPQLERYEVPTTTFVGARMAEVEELSGYSRSNVGPSTHEDIARVTESLKNLTGQAEIESRTTRLITAHTSLALHIAQQSRTLQMLSYSLLSPLTPSPAVNEIDEILPMVVKSISMIPQPPTQALSSLTHFAETSQDVIDTLNHLSDSLHMSKQITSTASRKLRSTKDIVAQIQKDNVASETGIRWIEKGEWERRLADRDCARVCRDVVGGFEQVCQGYRERLIDKAGIVVA